MDKISIEITRKIKNRTDKKIIKILKESILLNECLELTKNDIKLRLNELSRTWEYNFNKTFLYKGELKNLIPSTKNQIFNKCLNNNYKLYEKLCKNLKNNIIKNMTAEKFASDVVKYIVKNLNDRYQKEKHKNTMFRTSEFHSYLNPTMGYNEFIEKTITQDILKITRF